MKKLIAISLAIAFALPIASPTLGDPRYRVKYDDVNVFQHSFSRGNVRCVVRRGDRLIRDWGANWSNWIYVKVTHTSIVGFPPCHGWISKEYIEPTNRRIQTWVLN